VCVCVRVQGVRGSDELREERAWCHCTMASTGSSTSTAARLLVGERRSLLFPFPRNHDQRRMIHSVAVSNSQDRQLLLLRRSRRYCWISTTSANLPLRQDFNKMRRPKRLLNRPPLVWWSPFFSPGFCGVAGKMGIILSNVLTKNAECCCESTFSVFATQLQLQQSVLMELWFALTLMKSSVDFV
jgi:hypothetical protein